MNDEDGPLWLNLVLFFGWLGGAIVMWFVYERVHAWWHRRRKRRRRKVRLP